jgi:hypothetical protein
MFRINRLPGECFRAEPLRTENSWRVIGSRGTVEVFRVSKIDAEQIADALNALPENNVPLRATTG